MINIIIFILPFTSFLQKAIPIKKFLKKTMIRLVFSFAWHLTNQNKKEISIS